MDQNLKENSNEDNDVNREDAPLFPNTSKGVPEFQTTNKAVRVIPTTSHEESSTLLHIKENTKRKF